MTNDTFASLQSLVIDMDGVLWRGDTPMPGLVDFFEALRTCDINFVLATNNATRVAEQYAAKLQRFGVEVSPRDILTSAEATASYLRHRFDAGSTAYVVGEAGLRQAMEENGFKVLATVSLPAPLSS
jgi:4-nitrophenyl phosphatase